MIDQQIYNTDFPQFFSQTVKERGYNLKKLSEASGISIKHLESIARGDFAALPSAPYFHGYMQKLGQLLDFDAETWWTKLKEGNFVHDVNTKDSPVKNRFTKPTQKNIAWIAAFGLIILLYLGFQFTRIFGKPVIAVTFPSENPAQVSMQTVDITGTVKNATELYINNEPVVLASDGTWEKSVLLQEGVNTLQIRATKFLGGETTDIVQVIYAPAPANGTSTTTAP